MKKILLSICTLLAFAGSASADDAFSVDNVTLPQNGEADVTVRFSLEAGSTCSGYTFWLQVPEQLAFATYEKNEKTYITYTAGDCYDETPTFTPNIDGGYLKVGCLTANSDPLNKQSGVLVTFRLKVVGAVNVDDVLIGTLTNGTISAENGSVHNVADANFSITIAAPVDTRTVLDETSTTAPEAAAGVDVRVKRTIKADEWSTICLPFAMTTEQVKAAFGDDLRLGDFQGCEENGEKVNVKFAEATAIEANHPYIIKVSAPVSEFTVDGVDISPEDEPMIKKDKYKSKYNSFIGNYVNGTKVDDYGLYLMGGKFWYSKGNVNVKAFRGYFVFNSIDVDYDTARMDITFDDATGIRNIGHAADAERYYDLSGRVVSKPGKGIYVRNGQKMVVK